MKRVENNKREVEYDSLKPLFGSGGQPPFYDPNDLHAHIWHNGKLAIEDNPKIPTYSKSKINIRSCIYCKICHKVKDSFQSTVGKNKDIVQNNLPIILEEHEKTSYEFIEKEYINEFSIELVKSEKNKETKKQLNERLFLKPEGIFNNYVEIVDKEN